ncbi:LAME_0G09714g1_1 [Lachancea meyersii CBS 8951]|uniref:LAME_0G09714g1_1 n=1 Tax=Lachancea meyersii CBS 8951 TaxID=1266667 RepID=A0A1G4K8R8_9SACH|nr:LAME_0G09714g1_1 [Lachancea meyersii CBS 8951]
METSTFVKQLASNTRTVREEALESLKKYLTTRQFKDSRQLQFDKLWKGLYYAMWFSDRPRPQQRLASALAGFHELYFDAKDNTQRAAVDDNKDGEEDVDDVKRLTLNDKAFLKFSKAFWRVMCLEWYNIDHHRLDKYLLLVRRVLASQLRYLQLREWNAAVVSNYIRAVLRKLPLSGDKKIYNGIPFHIIDIFGDEWEKLVFGADEAEEDEEEDTDAEEMNDPEAKAKTQQAKIAETPLAQFIDIFRDLSSDTNNVKTMRDKIKEDILKDTRFQSWGVLGQDNDRDDAEEEWTGF